MKMRIAGLPLAAFALLAIPEAVTSANAQLNDTGRVLVASNTVRLESPEPVHGTGFFTGTAKRFLLPFNGVVRVKWKVRSGTAGKAASVSVISAVGTCNSGTVIHRTTTSTTFVDGQCDVYVAQGDIVHVSVAGTQTFVPPPGTSSTGFMKDVTVSFDVQNGTGLGKVLP